MSRLICRPSSRAAEIEDVAANPSTGLPDSDYDFDLDRYPARQRAHADSGAGVPAALTKHLHK
jgi:hypothetical protein